MKRFRIGDEFELDVGGSVVRGLIKDLFGFNDRGEKLWTVQIDGVNPGLPVSGTAMRPRRIAPQRIPDLLETDEDGDF